MIGFFRKLSQSWVAKILFAILAIAFAAYGVNSMLHGKMQTDVISAGPRAIDPRSFKTEMENEKKGMEQQQTQGQSVPWDVLQQQGVLDQMVQDMANQQAFSAWMQQVGLRPSDKRGDRRSGSSGAAVLQPGHRRPSTVDALRPRPRTGTWA